jgi:hypothetical protein
VPFIYEGWVEDDELEEVENKCKAGEQPSLPAFISLEKSMLSEKEQE